MFWIERVAPAVVGAIPTGFAIGWLSAAARRWADGPRVVISSSVLTPYAAHLPADQIGDQVMRRVPRDLDLEQLRIEP